MKFKNVNYEKQSFDEWIKIVYTKLSCKARRFHWKGAILMNFIQQIINMFDRPAQADIQSMFQAGGCGPVVKAQFWSGSPWQAFRRLNAGK